MSWPAIPIAARPRWQSCADCPAPGPTSSSWACPSPIPWPTGPSIQRAAPARASGRHGPRPACWISSARFRETDGETPDRADGLSQSAAQPRPGAVRRRGGRRGRRRADRRRLSARGGGAAGAAPWTRGLDLIRLATPTSDADRLRMVARRASGFLYYVSVAGVTGGKRPTRRRSPRRWRGRGGLRPAGRGRLRHSHARAGAAVARVADARGGRLGAGGSPRGGGSRRSAVLASAVSPAPYPRRSRLAPCDAAAVRRGRRMAGDAPKPARGAAAAGWPGSRPASVSWCPASARRRKISGSKCPDTGEMIWRPDLEAALWVTPAGRHMRIGPALRFAYTFDDGRCRALPTPRAPDDPLGFDFGKPYRELLATAAQGHRRDRRHGRGGRRDRRDRPAWCGCRTSPSWAARSARRPARRSSPGSRRRWSAPRPLVIFTASGGARMQEGGVS